MYHDVVERLAEHRHGVVATWELIAAGLTHDQIRRLLDSRHWERVGSGVVRRRGSAPTADQRVVAAVLDHGSGAGAAFLTGAHLFGCAGAPLLPIQIVGTVATRRYRTDVGYHRVRRIPDRWMTEVRGIPVVAPEMVAMQLFACSLSESAERRVDVLWSMGRLSGRSIEMFLSDMGRSGRNGVAGLRSYLDARGVDYRPPATGLESRAIQVLREAGIRVERQVDVGCDHAWTGRVDLRVVGLPVVVEVQSNMYHASLINRQADAARRSALEAAGFVWVELWEDDVWGHPWVLAPKVQAGIDACRRRPRVL
ncbi:type IV toxin-antitoxin system AbiEi family antitoxin domain-containing protein [Dermatobacter hominis]|uniref:type IV toxin-antitoxin system AbiEi family antitoxin domain-containing protein n=1 Tax=Dermatobacter hominis TaxID=2884263 RepID=UPI001D12E09B|nr:type IV toxin-antitoxin system AbiEi family antitoxin domain-containing protein [Dermatobacter hominis]UDY37948.1 type IV toxin-antitoxin system AbiEi family antitoxin domain-containing protein [Dermatobacter hominis]